VHRTTRAWLCVLATSLLVLAVPYTFGAQGSAAKLGPFDGHGDIGAVLHPGSAAYDGAKRTFMVRGSGENMWFTADAFHFVWQKVSGMYRSAPIFSLLGPVETNIAKPS
jgi:hypothetical protein